MSTYIELAIKTFKDNICVLEDKFNYLRYEVYVCFQNTLFEYEVTLKELDMSYDELEKLKKKYKVELRKEEEIREKGDKRGFMIFLSLNFLIRMIQGLLVSFICVYSRGGSDYLERTQCVLCCLLHRTVGCIIWRYNIVPSTTSLVLTVEENFLSPVGWYRTKFANEDPIEEFEQVENIKVIIHLWGSSRRNEVTAWMLLNCWAI